MVITKVDPDSDAADKGLQPGDVVLRIGNRAVADPADVQTGVAEAKKGGRKSVLLLVAHSQGGTGFVAIDIGQDMMFTGGGMIPPSAPRAGGSAAPQSAAGADLI